LKGGEVTYPTELDQKVVEKVLSKLSLPQLRLLCDRFPHELIERMLWEREKKQAKRRPK